MDPLGELVEITFISTIEAGCSLPEGPGLDRFELPVLEDAPPTLKMISRSVMPMENLDQGRCSWTFPTRRRLSSLCSRVPREAKQSPPVDDLGDIGPGFHVVQVGGLSHNPRSTV